MQLRAGVFPIEATDIPRVVDVWEASVRATHDFVTEADITVFRPLVREALAGGDLSLAGVRDDAGQVVGFIGVADGNVEMLFVHPDWRGQSAGRTLLTYAVNVFGARSLDVNEQNGQAVGFYQRMGFVVVGRSERDGFGKPYPLLHMQLKPAASDEPVVTSG